MFVVDSVEVCCTNVVRGFFVHVFRNQSKARWIVSECDLVSFELNANQGTASSPPSARSLPPTVDTPGGLGVFTSRNFLPVESSPQVLTDFSGLFMTCACNVKADQGSARDTTLPPTVDDDTAGAASRRLLKCCGRISKCVQRCYRLRFTF